MAAIELGDLTTDTGRSAAGNIIGAYLTWPDDDVTRHAFLAAQAALDVRALHRDLDFSAEIVASVLAKLEANGDRAAAERLREELAEARASAQARFEAHGGPVAVAFADSLPTMLAFAEKRSRDWATAGTILDMIRRMALHHADRGEASVNKAVHLVEWLAKSHSDLHKNEKDIRKAWSSHAPVAHLAATLSYMLHADIFAAMQARLQALPGPGPLSPIRLFTFLSAAANWQRFMLEFRQRHTKQPLLPPERIHLLPAPGPWPLMAWEPGPLSDAALAKLKEYRAPKRF
ncbi:MAG: hypothetical protein EP329_25900 [Deltaproteobacteria bacterium]|nr:MAG: hypothetical protein EP329_25900 [Deltaproteobacteria bacterium]